MPFSRQGKKKNKHIIPREIYFVGLFIIRNLIENLFNGNFTQILNIFPMIISYSKFTLKQMVLIPVLRRHLYGCKNNVV